MGSCGCSDFDPKYKLAGPKGSVYAIEITHPCHYCQSPAGVVFHKFTKKDDMRDWEINELPDLPFFAENVDQPLAAILVVDPWLLKEVIAKDVEAYVKDHPAEDIGAMPFVVEEAFNELLSGGGPLPGAKDPEDQPASEEDVSLAAAAAWRLNEDRKYEKQERKNLEEWKADYWAWAEKFWKAGGYGGGDGRNDSYETVLKVNRWHNRGLSPEEAVCEQKREDKFAIFRLVVAILLTVTFGVCAALWFMGYG